MNLFFVLTSLLTLFLGIFIYCKPQATFDIQKKFYAGINWHIEPISMEKEIRNTRWMGLFLILFDILACLYVLITK